MAQRKIAKSEKIQLTIDPATYRIISDMVNLGIHGTSKSEVASWIIRNWLWSNQDKLRSNGISLTEND